MGRRAAIPPGPATGDVATCGVCGQAITGRRFWGPPPADGGAAPSRPLCLTCHGKPVRVVGGWAHAAAAHHRATLLRIAQEARRETDDPTFDAIRRAHVIARRSPPPARPDAGNPSGVPHGGFPVRPAVPTLRERLMARRAGERGDGKVSG